MSDTWISAYVLSTMLRGIGDGLRSTPPPKNPAPELSPAAKVALWNGAIMLLLKNSNEATEAEEAA
jgi:hypothetical protein